MKIPAGWCPTCCKKGLDQLDVVDEATAKVATLKRAIPVAGVLGGRDAALAEACFVLDLPVPPDMQRQPLDEKTAQLLLAEIARRYGNLVVSMLMGTGLGERFMEAYRRREDSDKRRREEMHYDHYYMRYRSSPPVFTERPEPREKHYYVPEYRVKENKR